MAKMLFLDRPPARRASLGGEPTRWTTDGDGGLKSKTGALLAVDCAIGAVERERRRWVPSRAAPGEEETRRRTVPAAHLAEREDVPIPGAKLYPRGRQR